MISIHFKDGSSRQLEVLKDASHLSGDSLRWVTGVSVSHRPMEGKNAMVQSFPFNGVYGAPTDIVVQRVLANGRNKGGVSLILSFQHAQLRTFFHAQQLACQTVVVPSPLKAVTR